MGKQDRKGSGSLSNRDIFLRINFLYQAAYEVFTSKNDNIELVRFYISNLRSIAKKYVLRLHPSMKRTLCRKCCMLLVPGVTAKVRHRSKRQPHTVVTCQDCGVVKRFLSDEKYKLWIENMTSASTSSVISGTASVNSNVGLPEIGHSQSANSSSDHCRTKCQVDNSKKKAVLDQDRTPVKMDSMQHKDIPVSEVPTETVLMDIESRKEPEIGNIQLTVNDGPVVEVTNEPIPADAGIGEDIHNLSSEVNGNIAMELDKVMPQDNSMAVECKTAKNSALHDRNESEHDELFDVKSTGDMRMDTENLVPASEIT